MIFVTYSNIILQVNPKLEIYQDIYSLTSKIFQCFNASYLVLIKKKKKKSRSYHCSPGCIFFIFFIYKQMMWKPRYPVITVISLFELPTERKLLFTCITKDETVNKTFNEKLRNCDIHHSYLHKDKITHSL